MKYQETVDTGQIAKMLNCSRANVTDRITKKADFPVPVVNASSRLRRWKLEDVEKYIIKLN